MESSSSGCEAPPGGWPIPESAYIHVPFCRHRCGYCNFSVVAGRDDLVDQYLRAIDSETAMLGRPKVNTLFIGGGTPTHLSETQIERLFGSLQERFEFADGAELSVEANPEDICADKLSLLSDLGVNRISLGVQSFQDAKLSVLERGHDADRAAEAIKMSADAIPNVSLDLIFAAPDESVTNWQTDLSKALALPIQHLSTYALTFEKGTTFWNRQRSGGLQSVGDDAEVAMYNAARSATADHGMAHYEISNFAKPGYECRHNLAYWHGRGWYAAGPGAASFVDGKRSVNHRSTTTYLKRIRQGESPIAEHESISVDQYARERLAFGIRMLTGIDLDSLSAETGVDLRSKFADAIDQFTGSGLLARDGNHIRLSDHGVLFADTVASEFL